MTRIYPIGTTAICMCEWMDALRDRINTLYAQNIGDIHPHGQNIYLEHLQDAKECWYASDPRGAAKACRRAERRLGWEREG